MKRVRHEVKRATAYVAETTLGKTVRLSILRYPINLCITFIRFGLMH